MSQNMLTPEVELKICSLIREGVTDTEAYTQAGIGKATFYLWLAIGEAVRDGEDHPQMPVSEEYRQQRLDFLDAVTRARSQRKALLEKSIYSLGTGQGQVQKLTEDTFSETRIGKDGKPYTYTQTKVKREITEIPPDGKMALEYLSRQYGEDWLPAKQRIVLEQMSDETRVLLVRLLEKLEEMNMSASDVFNGMLARLNATSRNG